MATVPTGAKIRGPLADGGIRHWFLICAHFCAVMQGVLCSQACRRAQALCGEIVKRTFSEQGGLTLWPVFHKWTWHSVRFICAADMRDKVTPECGETKEAPFSGALTCLTMTLAHLTSLFARYSRLKIKRAPVSPHGSKCECLWQESVRPDFHSQWHQGALWPAAKLKIVVSGLARHTCTYAHTHKKIRSTQTSS